MLPAPALSVVPETRTPGTPSAVPTAAIALGVAPPPRVISPPALVMDVPERLITPAPEPPVFESRRIAPPPELIDPPPPTAIELPALTVMSVPEVESAPFIAMLLLLPPLSSETVPPVMAARLAVPTTVMSPEWSAEPIVRPFAEEILDSSPLSIPRLLLESVAPAPTVMFVALLYGASVTVPVPTLFSRTLLNAIRSAMRETDPVSVGPLAAPIVFVAPPVAIASTAEFAVACMEIVADGLEERMTEAFS